MIPGVSSLLSKASRSVQLNSLVFWSMNSLAARLACLKLANIAMSLVSLRGRLEEDLGEHPVERIEDCQVQTTVKTSIGTRLAMLLMLSVGIHRVLEGMPGCKSETQVAV